MGHFNKLRELKGTWKPWRKSRHRAVAANMRPTTRSVWTQRR